MHVPGAGVVWAAAGVDLGGAVPGFAFNFPKNPVFAPRGAGVVVLVFIFGLDLNARPVIRDLDSSRTDEFKLTS
jgi:hypothetical protein